MADIIIILRPSLGSVDGQNKVEYSGVIRLSTWDNKRDALEFTVALPFNTAALAINTTLKDAAVALVTAAGFSVGPMDKKILFGGPTEL